MSQRLLLLPIVSACFLLACAERDDDIEIGMRADVQVDMETSSDSAVRIDSQMTQMDLGLDAEVADAAPQDMTVLTPMESCSEWATLTNEGLVDVLHAHLVNTYAPITPTPNFGGVPDRYTTARELMFTRVERYQRDDEVFVVECIYTNDTAFTPPDRDPDDELMNCEHLWPRARLDSDRSSRLYEHQQSDLHHLAPSRPSANSLRGSLPFGDVVRDVNESASPSLAGKDSRGDRVFEPQDETKGDIARALFYMSIRWGLNISSSEEASLRQWHRNDPVTMNELAQNDEVEMIQGNRNPFVDCPGLVEQVDAFDAFSTLDTAETLPFP